MAAADPTPLSSRENESRTAMTKEERVAKINARQAIIVAVLTGLSGIAGALVQKAWSGAAATPPQYWLYIKGATIAQTADPSASVRVVALVDGNAYSYPSRAMWMGIGPEMTSEKFPLPIGKSSYQLSFLLYANRHGNTPDEYQSQTVITVKQPIEGEYKLYKLSGPDDIHWTRGVDLATVKYEIRAE